MRLVLAFFNETWYESYYYDPTLTLSVGVSYKRESKAKYKRYIATSFEKGKQNGVKNLR